MTQTTTNNCLELSAFIHHDPQQQIELEAYFAEIMSAFHTSDTEMRLNPAVSATPDQVFSVLTSREFSYLGKAKSAPYRQTILDISEKSIRLQQPIPFYYDIGGGYHAAPQYGAPLSFTVGLAELFVLRQIAAFADRIRSFYSPGVRFVLVIDNLCALLSNNIPIAKTTAYCEQLRALIAHLRLASFIEVLVESEHTSPEDFEERLAALEDSSHPAALTAQQYNNIGRFLGRHCSEEEAMGRAHHYARVLGISEQLLAPLITGIHMTQRATPHTTCFRSFPGGDSRIQCGEVVVTHNHKGKLVPILMTNVKTFLCRRIHLPHILPPMIQHATYVEHLTG